MPKNSPNLDAFDQAVLRDRGVSTETARRNRLCTHRGNLVIPYGDLSGQYDGYALRRPHRPLVRDGKAIKYLAPSGHPSRLYIPVECRTGVLDPAAELLLTEGPLKALALVQAGFVGVAVQGVWNWKVKGTDELLPDLAAVPLAGRVVHVVFDFDAKPDTREHVDLAERRLARAMRKAGAKEVYSVDLPPGLDAAKNGVDDFLVAHGAEAFRELVGQAQPVADLDGYHPLAQIEGRTDTNNAARFVATHRDNARWVGPWNRWLVWDGSRWKIDQSLAIDLMAKDVAASLFEEIAKLLRERNR